MIDTAGPNARITALAGGAGGGQGRFSYTLYTPDETKKLCPGISSIFSVETPVPEIKSGVSTLTTTGTNTSTFSKIPDLISTTYFSNGEFQKAKYVESIHVQSSTVFRSLGYETDNESISATAFGWGESLSGMIAVPTSCGSKADQIKASVTGGQGIAHYVVDLQTPSANLRLNGNDAYLNASNELIPLSVVAWYTSYLHYWNDDWQSNLTYSSVQLGGFDGPSSPLTAPSVSPYRHGEYVGVNLLYTHPFTINGEPAYLSHNWQTGIEYLYGQKETLDGSSGHDNRILFLTQINW